MLSGNLGILGMQILFKERFKLTILALDLTSLSNEKLRNKRSIN